MELRTSRNKACVNNTEACATFLQRMMNRLSVGHYRYGEPNSDQRYAKRLTAAVKKYNRTHNTEYLIDAANYCFLESIAPMYKDAHHKNLDSGGRNHIPS